MIDNDDDWDGFQKWDYFVENVCFEIDDGVLVEWFDFFCDLQEFVFGCIVDEVFQEVEVYFVNFFVVQYF